MIASAKTKVALVDDHHLVRAGLKLFIDYMPAFEVVGEAADGDEILQLLSERPVDILITDMSMRRVSGLEVIPLVKKHFPQIRIIALSMHCDRQTVSRALELGASGYVVKDSQESELQQALEAVSSGRRYVSPEVAGDLFAAPEPEIGPILTERQREILKMVALGRGSKEIAYHLGVSVKTVESHRAQIMERLAIRDVPTLVRYAIRNGIIDLDEGF